MTLRFRHPAVCWLSLNLGISGQDDETLTVIETEKASVRTETTVSEWLGPPYLSQSAVTCRVISVASSVSTSGYSAPKCQQYSENVIRDTLAHHETDMLDNFDTRQSFADLYLWILGGIDRFRLSHSSQLRPDCLRLLLLYIWLTCKSMMMKILQGYHDTVMPHHHHHSFSPSKV